MAVRILREQNPWLPVICVLLCLASTALTSCSQQRTDKIKYAEELASQGQYEEAISEYRAHMEERLAVKNRPEWENPYFYLLLIGDAYLAKGDATEALSSYEDAEKNGVHASLVSDRYRSVATWYEGKGELQKAFDALKKYRSRDTLLFDSMLDRIARTLTP